MTSNNSICSYDVKNNLRAMIGYRYDSDHDFYEQLKKAIYYDGETYIGVCERLIELIDGCCHGKVDVNADREAAADWVEDHGWLGGVQDLAKMDKFVESLAIEIGVSDDMLAGDELRAAVKAEIDKRLMPPGVEWPRFEDGAKVQYGDIYIFNGHACPIDTIRIENNGAFSIEAGKRIAYFARNGTVKRPEPEVFGADGVPIKVGETVYEVYDVGSAEVVKSITYVNNFCKINYESDGWGRPNVLTHTPPDTQERIDEDARVNSYDYCKKRGLDLTNYTVASKRDLLRRQRGLDKREMGGK